MRAAWLALWCLACGTPQHPLGGGGGGGAASSGGGTTSAGGGTAASGGGTASNGGGAASNGGGAASNGGGTASNGGGASQPDAGSLLVYRVAPSATDSAITQWNDDHVAMRDTTVSSAGALLVFLHGADPLVATDYQLLLATAAHQGYLAVALRYPNTWNAGALVDPADPNCTENARLELLDGTNRTMNVTVGPTDSIEHRLVALLTYLDQQHPSDGWGAYVAASAPKWSSIAIAGHSLGSGEAALIALKHATLRAALFSGPQDHCMHDAGMPAPWEQPGQTPSSAFFGFAHLDDSEEPLQLNAWSALDMARFGMPASSVNVDLHGPPYENAHELKTGTPATTDVTTAHRSTAADADTPLDGGVPLFAPVWRYMLGP